MKIGGYKHFLAINMKKNYHIPTIPPSPFDRKKRFVRDPKATIDLVERFPSEVIIPVQHSCEK